MTFVEALIILIYVVETGEKYGLSIFSKLKAFKFLLCISSDKNVAVIIY